jgi:hypothetical protein
MDAIEQVAGSNPVVDITEQTIDFKLYSVDPTRSSPPRVDHDIGPYVTKWKLPSTLLALRLFPLSQTFDQFRSQIQNENGQTYHDGITGEATQAHWSNLGNVSIVDWRLSNSLWCRKCFQWDLTLHPTEP